MGVIISPSTAASLLSSAYGKAVDLNAIGITRVYKTLTVLTTGSPADLGTITIPAGITRFNSTNGNLQVAETAAGTLAGATFQGWSAAGGTGTQVIANSTGPTGAGLVATFTAASATTPYTATIIHIRQTVDSANAGTITFYICLFPLPL